jgi:uncharacterized surface protein with fasciclin (FAS1) repeats
MRSNRRITGLIGLMATGVFVLGACSSAASTPAATTAPTTAPSVAASAEPSMAPSTAPSVEASPAAAGPFGAACALVPASGMGSVAELAKAPVANAASELPFLSTLVTAVTAAGLGDTLNTTKDITVFAPADDAFKAMDQATLKAALADPKGLLTKVLTYHVVAGQIAPDQLAGKHTTLQGGDIEITGSGDAFKVNGTSAVICGNVKTQNATVYVIDGVLLPPAS